MSKKNKKASDFSFTRLNRFDSDGRKIAWNQKNRTYLHYDCKSETTDRNYAWTGRREQFRYMKTRPEEFPIVQNFVCMLDGNEQES